MVLWEKKTMVLCNTLLNNKPLNKHTLSVNQKRCKGKGILLKIRIIRIRGQWARNQFQSANLFVTITMRERKTLSPILDLNVSYF